MCYTVIQVQVMTARINHKQTNKNTTTAAIITATATATTTTSGGGSGGGGISWFRSILSSFTV